MAPAAARVVHCKRAPYNVYIGRPSKWGNPFSHRSGTLAEFRVSTREEAITKYRAWIIQQPRLLEQLPELRGKILGCWCAPKSCHGDVLVELLEAPDPAVGTLEEAYWTQVAEDQTGPKK